MLSRDNRLVKYAVKLKQKKYRELEGKFIIEGIRFIEEALKEGKAEYILFCEKLFKIKGYERIMQEGPEKYEVSAEVIDLLSETENHQGAVAIVSKTQWSYRDIKNSFVVIADGVQDPGNLGTIIRTCDAAGAGAVIVVKGTVDVYNDKTLRSTMGSIFHLPVLYSESFEELSKELKGMGYNIYASSLEAESYIYSHNFLEKTALIIGNEGSGIPKEHLELSTHKVKIPMSGSAESLNAASAAAVMIYEVVRQRLKQQQNKD